MVLSHTFLCCTGVPSQPKLGNILDRAGHSFATCHCHCLCCAGMQLTPAGQEITKISCGSSKDSDLGARSSVWTFGGTTLRFLAHAQLCNDPYRTGCGVRVGVCSSNEIGRESCRERVCQYV